MEFDEQGRAAVVRDGLHAQGRFVRRADLLGGERGDVDGAHRLLRARVQRGAREACGVGPGQRAQQFAAAAFERGHQFGERADVVVRFPGGETAPSMPTVNYSGPFVFMGIDECPPLVADVRRMHAFRRVRLHADGFGEANMTLLGMLADIGQGESFAVGSR